MIELTQNTQGRAASTVSEDWDYNVVLEDLFTAEGKNTGLKCTRRTDTGKVLAAVTKDYGIANNCDVLGVTDDLFASRPDLGGYERKVRVLRDGARVYATYDFKDKTIEVPKVGDELGLRLTVNNSFDRSCRVSFTLGMLRLICTNGMTTLQQEYHMTKKHSNRLDLSFIKNSLDSVLEGFENLRKDSNIFTVMADREISQDQGLAILENLKTKSVIAEAHRENIARIWNDPSHVEDENRNLYNLLNASTEYITQNIEGERFELASRMTRGITSRLKKAAESGKVLETLTTLPKQDEVLTITE